MTPEQFHSIMSLCAEFVRGLPINDKPQATYLMMDKFADWLCGEEDRVRFG